MAIVAAEDDPNKYGFCVNDETFVYLKNYLSGRILYHTAHWEAIRAEFRKNRAKWEKDARIAWILDFRFNPWRLYFKFGVAKIKRILFRR